MWRLVMQCWNEPPKREKLQNVNTLEDVLELLQKSKKILVVTGAGVGWSVVYVTNSVSFRVFSKEGDKMIIIEMKGGKHI